MSYKMDELFSKRLEKIEPFIVMEVLEQAKELESEGKEVIHMEIGEPDFDTPKRVIEQTFKEVVAGKTHYTHSLGMFELREAIARYKAEKRGSIYDPKQNIMITNGTSGAFFNVMATILNENDEVIITDPGYPCYANFIKFFGAKPVTLPIYEENDFDLDANELKRAITPKTKAIILNSPSNPTGQIIKGSTLDEIHDIVKENNLWVISDEIYSELTYNEKIAPSLSDSKYKDIQDKIIVLDGFSKYWAMTGWRLGYIIGPSNLIKKMVPVQQNFSICAPSISQIAGIYALEKETEKETRKMLQTYKERRDYLVERINSIKGISVRRPNGAFYLFVNIKSLNISSREFSLKLLKEKNVATTPGISFGDNGEGFVRLSYANNLKNLKVGMDKIEEFIQEVK
ncbi:MAG: pyridoxal phosphate-dependent aminotransferase [Promethearchaeota archaeon]